MNRFVAPADWRAIDIISDLHLGETTPRTFDAWSSHLRATDADAVFILGDLFEVWVGDDTRASGFERRGAQVLAEATRRRWVGFMAGNRDFLVGPNMLAESGIAALDDPTLLLAWGRPVLLSHGDALCLGDVPYQRFRAEVRTDDWRQRFLARPLVERRALARHMRDASERLKRDQAAHEWVDLDTEATLQLMRSAGAHDLVHGHTHRPASHELAPGWRRHVLSDWDLEAAAPRAEVLRLTPDGFSRQPPAA